MKVPLRASVGEPASGVEKVLHKPWSFFGIRTEGLRSRPCREIMEPGIESAQSPIK